MSIGKQIRHFRLKRSARQEELADFVGVTTQAVSKWETDASMPDITLLPRIAMYSGVTIDELFRLSDEEQLARIENAVFNEQRIDDESFRHYANFLNRRCDENPDDADSRILLAQLYNHRAYADHQLADAYAREALALSPNEHAGWSSLIEANCGLCSDEWVDNHFTLIEFAKDFYAKHPGNFSALHTAALNLLADGRIDEAEPYVQKFTEYKGREYLYKVLMGDIKALRGDIQAALALWNEAVEDNPTIWQAWCDRADRMKKLGRYDEALSDYEKCFTVQNPPRISDGLYSRAQLFEQLGRYDEAITERRRIIKCLEDEYDQHEGESIDEQLRNIKRLENLSKEA
ncbi:MAG: helix-turn-helix domain-containing protein [Clostridia bacterium]|nr:helix-turn-helix domain-containing protein [Clostridia bacterium]